MYGWRGIFLRVNLENRNIWKEPVDEHTFRNFIGCMGIGTIILTKELKMNADPLGNDNILIFMTGPLTGSGFPGTSRYTVMAKSPLTGLLGEARAGGYFGRELKRSGYDGIIIEGKAEKPVYLWINDDHAEIKDAEAFWGLDTFDAEDQIRKDCGSPLARVASIGPAGERLVRYACIICDKCRAAGRTGMGAVMGSKRLKAIAVQGTKRYHPHEETKLKQLHRQYLQLLKESPYAQSRKKMGSSEIISAYNVLGMLPTYNFRQGYFAQADQISGETLIKTLYRKPWSCADCPLGSGKCVEVTEGPFAPVSPELKGPEYETLAAFGSLCGNSNLESICRINELCNRYGLDTISTGVTIAFIMECSEKGLVNERLPGMNLGWGDAGSIIELVNKIAYRQEIGDLLAEGVMRVAAKIGNGSEHFAMQIKGLELPMHDPRGKKGLALSFVTANRGCSHMEVIHDTYCQRENLVPEIGIVEKLDPYLLEGKSGFVKKAQEFYAIIEMLPLCKWIAPPRNLITLTHLIEILEAATGWKTTPEELLLAGERVINLGRSFNFREGMTAESEKLPARLYEVLGRKEMAFDPDEFKRELRNFYSVCGWDPYTGIPAREKLMQLGIAETTPWLVEKRD